MMSELGMAKTLRKIIPQRGTGMFSDLCPNVLDLEREILRIRVSVEVRISPEGV